MAGNLQGPIIPLLIDNTIDPQALGGAALPTYAKYDNPQLGDVLYQNWLGIAQDGTPVEVKDIPIEVDPEEEREEGFVMEIAFELVQQLDRGQAVYSYFLERAGQAREESKRIHFGIGQAPWLPAPQIKESHDRQIDPDAIVGSTITIAIPPYGAMAEGDVVKLFWEGVRADSCPGPRVGPFAKTLSDDDTDRTNDPARALSWTVARTSVIALRGGSINLYYEIDNASPTPRAGRVSAQRRVLVTPPTAQVLAAPTVKDLVGTVINPGQFPDGIVVVVALYPDIRIGDDVLVYGTGSGPARNTIEHLKVDQSTLDKGQIEVPVAAQWLMDNQGGGVVLHYQYGRADAAGSGTPLELTVGEQLILPPPSVDGSVFVGGRDEFEPMIGIGGALIAIPPEAPITDGDTVIAYWSGFGETGSAVVEVPSQLEPMKFKVPSTVLPANFNKTVEVTYSVSGQLAEPALQLYIRRFSVHPTIHCQGMQIGSPAVLERSKIPTDGALVTIERWPFMATDQLVRLWLTSNGVPDQEIVPLRPVTLQECGTGVTGRLLLSHLEDVQLNGTFTVRASVSFDGGNTTTVFNPLQLKLVA